MSLWFKKIFSSNRIINIWNSLPDSVAMADTVNQFKNRLDKYWKKIMILCMITGLPTLELEADSECNT